MAQDVAPLPPSFWRLGWQVIWADPGRTTGLAWLTTWPLVPGMTYPPGAEQPLYGWAECDFTETVQTLDRLISRVPGSRTLIGWEDYRLGRRQRGPVMTEAPWSLEVIGAIKCMAVQRGPLTRSAEAGDRSHVTRGVLDVLSWLPDPGNKDAFAASQHLVAFLMREKALPAERQQAVLAYLAGSV